MDRSHYDVLGVPRDASTEEIHRAYRRLARRYHPDLSGKQDGRFGELTEAYEVLHDPTARGRYDRAHPEVRRQRAPEPRVPVFTARPAPDVPRFHDEPVPFRLVVRFLH